ncbi:hypothetical protein [Actinacidiphila sp. ITFR-21]|uniref:hypothetical protein n=1 Tax=Actinacidiphila sp. ITFR-21 TaxID=3075199 RepID=UPI00288BB421|nr:hypothetical protein [Streptomyces sp. ITFR-21]WNI15880.1 hypothetical protein RLT57_10315 [Streptomyces sp. ITFR-21]
MGAFDQFRDTADEYADKPRTAVGNRRNESAVGTDNPERMERGPQQNGQGRRSRFKDEARERTGSEQDDQDTLA